MRRCDLATNPEKANELALNSGGKQKWFAMHAEEEEEEENHN